MSGIEFLPLVVIALLFWLLVIRPQGRRQRELRNLQSSLSVGDEVMLTSGIFATVRSVDDENAMVEVAEGVILKVARGAIGTTLPTAHDEVHERMQDDQDPQPDDRPLDDRPFDDQKD